MKRPIRLFENIFIDKRITDTRLVNFGAETEARLIELNSGGLFTVVLAQLTPAVAALRTELGSVDTSLNQRKGATLGVDDIIIIFKATMREEEGYIAKVMGGRKTPGFIEFYPHKKSEYGIITKTNVEALMGRVSAAATTYTVQIGTELTQRLQSFPLDYRTARDRQAGIKGLISDSRGGRSDARITLENACMFSVNSVRMIYPNDPEKCQGLFDFNLLFHVTHRGHDFHEGVLNTNASLVVINRSFTDVSTIRVKNPSQVADIRIGLSHTGTGSCSGNGIIVKAGHGTNFKPSKLGSLSDTFLTVTNLSDINGASYEVEIIG